MGGRGTKEGLLQPLLFWEACIAWSWPFLRVKGAGIRGLLAPLLLMLSSPSAMGIETRRIMRGCELAFLVLLSLDLRKFLGDGIQLFLSSTPFKKGWFLPQLRDALGSPWQWKNVPHQDAVKASEKGTRTKCSRHHSDEKKREKVLYYCHCVAQPGRFFCSDCSYLVIDGPNYSKAFHMGDGPSNNCLSHEFVTCLLIKFFIFYF